MEITLGHTYRWDATTEKSRLEKNNGFEDNPYDMRRHRKRENRRNKVVKGSTNFLGSCFTGGVKENPLCDILVHHVANQSTLGDLKNHLCQQGFDVAGM